MNRFTLLQKIRNKVRVIHGTRLDIAQSAKIVNCSLTVKGKNNLLIIKEGARIRDAIIEIIGDDCLIEIGKNSMIGKGSYISAKEQKSKLIIGDDCGLSRNVKVMTSDGHPIYQSGIRINPAKDITIENYVWIADNVTILKGVTIGSGSVIGINSTVVKSVSKNVVAVGNPAKVVKENIEWRDKY